MFAASLSGLKRIIGPVAVGNEYRPDALEGHFFLFEHKNIWILQGL
jgi:hypothetical protein